MASDLAEIDNKNCVFIIMERIFKKYYLVKNKVF